MAMFCFIRRSRRFLALLLFPLIALGATALSGCGGGSGDSGGCNGFTPSVTVNTYDGSNRYIGDFKFTQYNSGCGNAYTVLNMTNRSGQPLCVAYRVEFFDSANSRRWSYEGNINYLPDNRTSNEGTVSTSSIPIDSGVIKVTFLSDPYNACSGGNNPLAGNWEGQGRTSGSFNPSIPARNANISVAIGGNGSTNISVRFLNSGGFENGNVEYISGSTDSGAYFEGNGSGPWGSFSVRGFFEDRGNGVRGVNLDNYYFGGQRPEETITGTIYRNGKTTETSVSGKKVALPSPTPTEKTIGAFGGGKS